MLNKDFHPIAGRTFDDCDGFSGNEIGIPIRWRGQTDLSKYRGEIVHLRFRMRAAKLFAIKAI